MTDKTITDAEIAPAIPELNKWLRATYPGYSGTYTYTAASMVGPNRLIALMIAKMMANGFKPVGVTKPDMTQGAYVTKTLDLLRSTSYAETGSFVNATAGNLNDIPGGVLLNLMAQGATIEQQGSRDVQVAYAKGYNDAKAEIEGLLRNLKPGWA